MSASIMPFDAISPMRRMTSGELEICSGRVTRYSRYRAASRFIFSAYSGDSANEVAEATAVLSGHPRRIASVCTGAFLLAELGLLDGRRVTTHWRNARDLARRYPRIRVETDVLHVHDGLRRRHEHTPPGKTVPRVTGATPSRWLEQFRMSTAQQLILDGQTVTAAAGGAGFGSDESLRRAFDRHLHITPSEYRARFSSTFRRGQ